MCSRLLPQGFFLRRLELFLNHYRYFANSLKERKFRVDYFVNRMDISLISPAKMFAFPISVKDNEELVCLVFKYECKHRSDVAPCKISLTRPPAEKLIDSCSKIAKKLENLEFPIKAVRKLKGVETTEATEEVAKSPGISVSPAVQLHTDSSETLLDFLNRSVPINIEGLPYEVIFRPPRIEEMRIKTKLLLNFPVVINLKLFDASDSDESTRFVWFYGAQNHELLANLKDPSHLEQFGWRKFHEGQTLSLLSGDDLLGKHLLLVGFPEKTGQRSIPVAYVTKETIQSGPQRCIFDSRHALTKDFLPKRNALRVATYNILADLYVEAGEKGYFPYCPEQAICYEYRYPLLLKELQGYHADIILLQEVDVRMFQSYLSPLFMQGTDAMYGGFYAKKGNLVNEGCAILFRREHFTSAFDQGWTITELLDPNNNPENFDLTCLAAQSPSTVQVLQSRPSVLQVAVLKMKGESPAAVFVICATTHLFFHPEWPHVKIIQMAACLRKIESIRDSIVLENPGAKVHVIFGGDYNATPSSGVYELATEGRLSAEYTEWEFGKGKDKLGTTVHDFKGIDIHHTLKLRSACGTPQFTNYTAGFKGCLDYIFIDDSLHVDKVLPLPSEEEMTLHTALPSFEAPSDHLALVCELGVPQHT